jgi:hypothetical protein
VVQTLTFTVPTLSSQINMLSVMYGSSGLKENLFDTSVDLENEGGRLDEKERQINHSPYICEINNTTKL